MKHPASARSFRDLDVWRLGKTLALEAYRVTRGFPSHERFGLSAQIRRSAVSIPSNIAEGFNRAHRSEYRQYLFIALGSCGELDTQLEIAHELGYLADHSQDRLIDAVDHESKMLRNLIKRLDSVSPDRRTIRRATSDERRATRD
jgi:four helix bundle protein